MDFGTIGGIVFAIGMILVGQAIEGGHVGSILQLTAAMIVFGGTFGAVAVSFPLNEFFRGLKMGAGTLKQKKSDLRQILDQVVDLAGVARRDGVLALEQRVPELKDAFLKRAVGFIVDGVDATVARDALETEIMREYEEGSVGAKVFESMGGYAPTVGILGAVLGLIHVMENLNDPSKLGGGIATAFVATVYGVGSANLTYLVTHEIAHQWFYGIVGNDQAREPFADEAPTDFVARDILGMRRSSRCSTTNLDRTIYRYSSPCYYEVVYIQGGNLLAAART